MSLSQTLKPGNPDFQDKIDNLVSWANQHLSGRGIFINDITHDFSDGTNFLNLYEVLTKRSFPITWCKTPTSVAEKRKNIGAFLTVLQNGRIVKHGAIRADDILWGATIPTFYALRALRIYLDREIQKANRSNSALDNSPYAEPQDPKFTPPSVIKPFSPTAEDIHMMLYNSIQTPNETQPDDFSYVPKITAEKVSEFENFVRNAANEGKSTQPEKPEITIEDVRNIFNRRGKNPS